MSALRLVGQILVAGGGFALVCWVSDKMRK